MFNFLVPLFRPSLFRVVLFSIFQFTEAATGGVLKTSANFIEKDPLLLKRDSNTGAFL